jgi:hypothetical protein
MTGHGAGTGRSIAQDVHRSALASNGIGQLLDRLIALGIRIDLLLAPARLMGGVVLQLKFETLHVLELDDILAVVHDEIEDDGDRDDDQPVLDERDDRARAHRRPAAGR